MLDRKPMSWCWVAIESPEIGDSISNVRMSHGGKILQGTHSIEIGDCVKYQTQTRVIIRELAEAGRGKPRWEGLASTCVLRPSRYRSAQISGW
jgi:hypothetical protein